MTEYQLINDNTIAAIDELDITFHTGASIHRIFNFKANTMTTLYTATESGINPTSSMHVSSLRDVGDAEINEVKAKLEELKKEQKDKSANNPKLKIG